jgi:hypothetical protein
VVGEMGRGKVEREGEGEREVDEGPVSQENRQASVSLCLIVGLFCGLLGIFCGITGLARSRSLALTRALSRSLSRARALSRMYIYTHMFTPGRRETNDGRRHISNTLATH